ncbi:MAG: aldo/keto reductase [Planctomycetota bacterium]
MHTSRREFLRNTTVAAGSAAALGSFDTFCSTAVAEPAVAEAPAPIRVKSGTEIVTLGKTGLKTSVLGIGCGTRGGREQRGVPEDGFDKVIRYAFDSGIRYIDTADAYKTHPYVNKALKELPRDQVFLLSKSTAKTAEKAQEDIERLRSELGVDQIDTLLIHCMTKKDWPTTMRPVIDVFLDAKRKGQIKALGVSCHNIDALDDAVACDDIELHLVRINPFDLKMEGTHSEIAQRIAKMHEKNRGVLGMKVFGESGLNSPEERLQSLKYVLGLGAVHAFTIGFHQTAHIDETLKLIEQAAA